MEKRSDQLVAHIIGFNMSRIREERKVPTKEAASALKITEDEIRAIEAGARFCTVAYIVKFISLFNIKFEELIECYEQVIENFLIQEKQGAKIERLCI